MLYKIKSKFVRRSLLCVFILPVVAYITGLKLLSTVIVISISAIQDFMDIWKGE